MSPARAGVDGADHEWLTGQLRGIGERYDQAHATYQRLTEHSGQILRTLRRINRRRMPCVTIQRQASANRKLAPIAKA